MKLRKNNYLKTSLCTLLLVVCLSLPLLAQTIDKIIAVVNEEVITQTDLRRVLATIETEYKNIYSGPQEFAEQIEQAKKNIINQIVEEKLILSEAKKYEIKVEEETIAERIDKIKQGFASEEEFEQALILQGLTLKDLRDRFTDQEMMKKAVDYFVRFKIEVDPIEIREFYQAHPETLIRPEEVRLKSILIKLDQDGDELAALEKAKIVLERLKQGDSFEDLAKKYSQGTNAQEGGDLGFIARGQLIEKIDQAIFELQPGEFTDVIRTNQGYRIFQIVEKKPAKELSFTQAYDLIRDQLYKRKFTETFKDWLSELKQNAYIRIEQETYSEEE